MKKQSLYIAMLLLFSSGMFAQVGINTDNSPLNTSAGLDVKFSNKGFLPPRIELTATNVATPVVSPAIGLLVYNTATAGTPPTNVIPGYFYWDGSRWVSLSVPSGTVGPTLRNDGNNCVADGLFYNDGTNIGIGTISTYKLSIAGTTETVQLMGPGSWGEGAKLNFGDANYVYLSEDLDDKLLIQARDRTAIMGGNVGIGTITPGQRLTVDGTIQTISGGVMFPDGTTQITAAGNVHIIGENYGGGIVFNVYDGGRHGLIAATAVQSTGIRWHGGSNTNTRARADGVGAGLKNTSIIIANQGPVDGTNQLKRSQASSF